MTDNLTGLMWMQEAYMSEGPWTAALSACASCDEGGYSDWRLPNVKELQSLIDYGQYEPALSGGFFFDLGHGPEESYWSSTTVAGQPDSAWVVYFRFGDVARYCKDHENCEFYYKDARVWCVRGGR